MNTKKKYCGKQRYKKNEKKTKIERWMENVKSFAIVLRIHVKDTALRLQHPNASTSIETHTTYLATLKIPSRRLGDEMNIKKVENWEI